MDITSFHNPDTNMTSIVFQDADLYGVALRDDDSGHILNYIYHGYTTLEAACLKAEFLVRN